MQEIKSKKFRVNKIVFYNNESKWGVLGTTPVDDLGEYKLSLMNDFSNVTVAGNFVNVYEGAEVIIDGDIICNPKYGNQVQIRNYKVVQDCKSREGVVNFLSKSEVAGISTQNANKIFDVFGKDSLNIVLRDPDQLEIVSGIGKKTIERIKESSAKYLENEEFYNYIADLGISYSLGEKILNEFGKLALAMVQSDPFMILDHSPNITFKQVDEIFIKQGGDPENSKRLSTGLLYILRQLAMLDGSTGVVSWYLKSKFYKMLNIFSSSRIYENTIKKLDQKGMLTRTDNTISGNYKGKIYYKGYVDLEHDIASKLLLLEKYGEKHLPITQSLIDMEVYDFPFTLNEQQREAIYSCLEHPVSILTGAAGCLTGDSLIKYKENSLEKEIQLKDLYEHFKSSGNQVEVKSYIEDEDSIRFNLVKDVVYSGKKEVFRLTLEDGKYLKATATHEILTKDGFKELQALSSSDYIMIDSTSKSFSRVISIEPVGIKDTYDICCFRNHNFVANGIVVHNSGKSSITKALYNIYKKSGYNTVLLAPTAKAVRRIEECTGGDAQTIHKFLKMNKDGSFPAEKDSLKNTVVIIDEASMLDIILFSNLLSGISVTTRILLVGDNNQLPSVQAGNVLGDAISSGKIHTAYLTDVVRQQESSNIIKYCSMINKGKIIDPCDHDDFHYEEFGTAKELREVLFTNYIKEVGAHGLNEVQVIAPYKKGELGMDNLNLMLQEIYQREYKGEEYVKPYREGDKVRHTVNNYKKEVFNGETGIVSGYADEELIVYYTDKVISYTEPELEELTLSYASTVHSSQGSEYKVVFVILDDTSANDFLHIRRLLYTAVSRGKERVYIYTKPYLVDKCIFNTSYRERITKLKEYLENPEEDL